jgi:hypothetical protein
MAISWLLLVRGGHLLHGPANHAENEKCVVQGQFLAAHVNTTADKHNATILSRGHAQIQRGRDPVIINSKVADNLLGPWEERRSDFRNAGMTSFKCYFQASVKSS